MSDVHRTRQFTIQIIFIAVALMLVSKAAHLQIFNKEQQTRAKFAAISRQVLYPARGIMYDRNNERLVYNDPMYDLMVTYNKIDFAVFDTVGFCNLTGMSVEGFSNALNKDWRSGKFSKSVPFIFKGKISAKEFAFIQEHLHRFPAFTLQMRSARGYPHSNAAHVLGYIREVNQNEISADSSYQLGDYIGASGLERYYEKELRGEKGIRHVLIDNLGREVNDGKGAEFYQAPVEGKNLYTTLDLELQKYGESLMVNKIGSIVAIEPATGEILAMISAPSYDPNHLTIDQSSRAQKYGELLNDASKPFLDRSILAQYPPGSLFKPIVALIALQEGVMTPERHVGCSGGYYFGGQRLTGCHNHVSCSNVASAIQHSCNAYFVTVFRDIVDKYGHTHPNKGFDEFNTYLKKFGLGDRLGVDFPGEKKGFFPNSDYYNGVYQNDGFWKSIWIRSLGIGQGELLLTNIQIANLAATLANRGYYITPHLVSKIGDAAGGELVEPAFQRRETGIDKAHFVPVIDGMEKVVLAGTARSAYIPDISICGKTGTAENPHGEDHSIFFAFAPKEKPEIAIAVYIENGGWGGSYAAPIASLMIEKYKRGSISEARLFLEKRMKEANLLPKPEKVANKAKKQPRVRPRSEQ
ncbi:MAG: penicillin-binding protein 2 [Saprospiraceae bacterium]|nr:penicillin-binding protein 2 [Saprospiraceae bacterium]